MANNCSNYIIISGEIENVKKATDFWRKELIEDYDKINYLSELSIMTEKEKEDVDPYACVGTKWIDNNYVDDSVPDQVTISCISAWSPPLPLLKRMAEVFDVTIECEYSEPGCDFGGKFICDKDNDSNDYLSYLKYVGKYEDDRLLEELDFFVEDDSLTMDILEEVKEYLTEEEYNEYLTKIKEDSKL